jgi:hypothetical protein
LVKPSLLIKEQFQAILSQSIDDINVFMFDEEEFDISWLLSVAHQADVVIIDIDNCDSVTKQFISFLLAQPNAHYITNNETVPYNLISKNRIWNLSQIVEQLQEEDGDEEEGEDE